MTIPVEKFIFKRGTQNTYDYNEMYLAFLEADEPIFTIRFKDITGKEWGLGGAMKEKTLWRSEKKKQFKQNLYDKELANIWKDIEKAKQMVAKNIARAQIKLQNDLAKSANDWEEEFTVLETKVIKNDDWSEAESITVPKHYKRKLSTAKKIELNKHFLLINGEATEITKDVTDPYSERKAKLKKLEEEN